MQQEDKRVPLKKGTLIGEFTIDKVIGYGGSSICYSAISNDRKVIIKEVYPKSIETYLIRNPKNQALEFLNETLEISFGYEYKAAIERQKREKEIANILRDPYDENNSYFFACYSIVCKENSMEYLVVDTEGGQMLQEIISHRNDEGLIRGFEDIDDIIEITKRIIEAIEPIHKLNKLHCDLSPDNIFVSNAKQDNKNGRRNIKSIDFNSTFTLGENLNDFSFSKKEGYSPIELIAKRMNWQISFGTDLYGVAAILFNMIYNELFIYDNFADDGFDDKLVINKESAYILQLNIPAQHKLQEIFEKALLDRYAATDLNTAAQKMINDLNELHRIQKNEAGYSKERIWNMSNAIFVNTYKRLHGDGIVKSIMPELHLSSNDKGKITLNNGLELLDKYQQNNLFFIFAQKGGAGKTTHLMLMWKYFAENYNANGPVPLYISLGDISNKMLSASGCKDEYSIRRMISEQYGGVIKENCNDTTSINGLNALFEQGRYLLLLDGLNEVKHEASSFIYREIENLSINQNIVIVITSRFIANNSFLTSKAFMKIELGNITSCVIEDYLGKEMYLRVSSNSRLLEVLSNPMMLSIYKSIVLEDTKANAYAEQLITPEYLSTAGELLELYLKCHLFKYKRQQASDRIDKRLKRILEVHLPQLGYAMYEGNTLTISEEKAEDVFKELDFELVKVKDIFNIGEEYNFISISDDYDESYVHMHQLIRDFFASKHLKNAMEDIIKDNATAPHKLFNDIIHTKDIRQLLGELCHDYIYIPYVDTKNNRWTTVYLNSENDKHLLNLLLSTCRNVKRPEMKYEVLNIVRIMSLMRDNDLSGMDMSYLDLTGLNLKNIRWSRNYYSSYLSADFTGAVFTENNWLPPYASTIMSIVSLDKYDNYFAAGTNNGEIQIWNKNTEMCEFAQKIVDAAVICILISNNILIFLTDENKVWTFKLGIDRKPVESSELKYDLSNFPAISSIEVNTSVNKKGDIVFYTYDKPTTKHYLDGSFEGKEQMDYCASAVNYNKLSKTWLRNTIFEGNIILEETIDCRPISNYKGHNSSLGHVVNSIRFDPLFEKFVSTTTNREVFIWDYKSHQIIAKYYMPGKNIKGAIFLQDGQLLVYGDELFSIDIEGKINMFSSPADQNVLAVVLNSIYSGNYHHHVYVLSQKSIRVINIDNDKFLCESIIDVSFNNHIYRHHEISFLSAGEPGSTNIETISAVSYTKTTSEIRKFSLKTCFKDSSDFDAACERLISPDRVIKTKGSKYDGCFVRILQDAVLFNDNAARRLVGYEKIPLELKIQKCMFTNNGNISLRLKDQFDRNCVLWDESAQFKVSELT